MIVTNHKIEVRKIVQRVNTFLSLKGFKSSYIKSKLFKLNLGKVFNFLGFTFKFIKKSKLTRLTKRVNEFKQVLKPRVGLFIYVSNDSVKGLKNKLNSELKVLSQIPFRMIKKLNPIL